jgi:hypothetical protein
MQLELSDSPVRTVDLLPGDMSTEFNQSVTQTAKTDRYDSKIAKTWETIERNMKKAPGPDLVARHVLKLINTVRPPPRVTVGNVFESKNCTAHFQISSAAHPPLGTEKIL